MRVMRHTYTRAGVTRTVARWYVDLRDHAGIRRRVPGFRSKSATTELGRKLARLVECRGAREPLPLDLAAWIETMPPALAAALVRYDVLDARRVAASRALSEQVDEYAAALLDRGNTEQHARQTATRVRLVLDGIGARFWTQLDARAVERLLADRRRAGWSAATSNYHLAALRGWVRWLIGRGLVADDPLAGLRPVRSDPERRRALTDAEVALLLAGAEAGPKRFGMTGPQRALAYRLALETGLRAGEIRSLRVGSFEGLDTQRPAVRLLAAYSKRRREDVLPIRPTLARALAGFLRRLGPGAVPFPVGGKAARMVRADLGVGRVADPGAKRAGKNDPESLDVDFHALRHTFITGLHQAGVAPKTAQALARHSTITLTLDRYTHLAAGDERRALEGLPEHGRRKRAAR